MKFRHTSKLEFTKIIGTKENNMENIKNICNYYEKSLTMQLF